MRTSTRCSRCTRRCGRCSRRTGRSWWSPGWGGRRSARLHRGLLNSTLASTWGPARPATSTRHSFSMTLFWVVTTSTIRSMLATYPLRPSNSALFPGSSLSACSWIAARWSTSSSTSLGFCSMIARGPSQFVSFSFFAIISFTLFLGSFRLCSRTTSIYSDCLCMVELWTWWEVTIDRLRDEFCLNVVHLQMNWYTQKWLLVMREGGKWDNFQV